MNNKYKKKLFLNKKSKKTLNKKITLIYHGYYYFCEHVKSIKRWVKYKVILVEEDKQVNYYTGLVTFMDSYKHEAWLSRKLIFPSFFT